MSEGQKSSGVVTVLSIVGLVFGLIGMMGSFIPCLGSLAFFVGLPAALISGLALFIARANNSSRTFALVALTISLIGVVVSGTQYFSIVSAGKSAEQEIEAMSRPNRGKPIVQEPQPAPAPVKPPVDTSGINIVQQDASAPVNSDEAKALFVRRYYEMMKSAGYRVDVQKELIVNNTKEWTRIPIVLKKGLSNTIKIDSGKHSIVLLRSQKAFEGIDRSSDVVKKYKFPVDGEPGSIESKGVQCAPWDSLNHKDGTFYPRFSVELIFEASHKDLHFEIYVPAAYKADYKITLENARVDN